MWITPIRKMVTTFSQVVDYRSYRLRNTQREFKKRDSLEIYHVKQLVDGLHPTLDVFDGRKPIRLLSFLTNPRVRFNTLGKNEAGEVHVYAYFLGGEDQDVYAGQLDL